MEKVNFPIRNRRTLGPCQGGQTGPYCCVLLHTPIFPWNFHHPGPKHLPNSQWPQRGSLNAGCLRKTNSDRCALSTPEPPKSTNFQQLGTPQVHGFALRAP